MPNSVHILACVATTLIKNLLIKQLVPYFRTNMAMEESRTDEELREDLTRLSDEVLRLETSMTTLQDSLLQMGDKVKEVGTLKDTVMVISKTTNKKIQCLRLTKYFKNNFFNEAKSVAGKIRLLLHV